MKPALREILEDAIIALAIVGAGAVLLLAYLVASAEAQRTTELYVPIGQSTGVSGTSAAVEGYVWAVGYDASGIQAIGIRAQECVTFPINPTGLVVVYVGHLTPERKAIYIDNSAQGRRNEYGTLQDLAEPQCRYVEAYAPLGEDGRRVAKWVKIKGETQ